MSDLTKRLRHLVFLGPEPREKVPLLDAMIDVVAAAEASKYAGRYGRRLSRALAELERRADVHCRCIEFPGGHCPVHGSPA